MSFFSRLSARHRLRRWHAERRAENYVYNHKHETRAYCFSDVMVLAESCVRFTNLFAENGFGRTQSGVLICGYSAHVYPLHECTTIAQAALMSFRRSFMKEDQVMVDRPACGRRKQSALALRYFHYLRSSQGAVIQDALHPDGEYAVSHLFCYACRVCHLKVPGTSFSVDGLQRNADGSETALEVKGCFWHCCSCRYSPWDEIHGKLGAEIRQRDSEREEAIRRTGLALRTIRECDLYRQMALDPEMKQTMMSCPLRVRT